MTGGLGDDTFVYFDIFDRGDTVIIQGQNAAAAVFDLRAFDFDPNTPGIQSAVGGLKLFNKAPVTGLMEEDAIYYSRDSGRLSIDTGNDGYEDFFIIVNLANGSPPPQVNADDFLL